MNVNLINNGNATTIWHGLSSAYLCAICKHATPNEAQALSTAASLMLAGECTKQEWAAAETAARAVEGRLIAAWEAKNGPPALNKRGQIMGGVHPAIDPTQYDQALATSAQRPYP